MIRLLLLTALTALPATVVGKEPSIFCQDLETGVARYLVRSHDCDWHGSPRFSPDGRSLAFEAMPRRGGPRKVFVAAADGSNPRPVIDGSQPEWSPDGLQLCCVRYEAAFGQPALWVVPVDGQEPQRLCGGEFPSWSPDGRQMLRIDIETAPHVCRSLDLFSTESHVLQGPRDAPHAQATVRAAAWSPQGDRVALVEQGDRAWRISVVRPDQPLVPPIVCWQGTRGIHGRPAWSPDGQKLAFAWRAETPAGRFELCLLSADGGEPTLLSGQDGPWRFNVDPSWSPDGRSLVFSSNRPED